MCAPGNCCSAVVCTGGTCCGLQRVNTHTCVRTRTHACVHTQLPLDVALVAGQWSGRVDQHVNGQAVLRLHKCMSHRRVARVATLLLQLLALAEWEGLGQVWRQERCTQLAVSDVLAGAASGHAGWARSRPARSPHSSARPPFPPQRCPAGPPWQHPGAQAGQGGLARCGLVPRWSRWPAVI